VAANRKDTLQACAKGDDPANISVALQLVMQAERVPYRVANAVGSAGKQFRLRGVTVERARLRNVLFRLRRQLGGTRYSGDAAWSELLPRNIVLGRPVFFPDLRLHGVSSRCSCSNETE